MGVGPVQGEMRLSSGGPHVGGRVVVVAIVRNSVKQELAVVERRVPVDIVDVPCHGVDFAVEAELSCVLPLVWGIRNAAEEGSDVGVVGDVLAVPE